MTVGQCRQEDLPLLERQLPSGRNRYHEARFRRQREGRGAYLVACLEDVPTGAGEVLWQAKEPEVRERFPGCPEINGLAVVPERQSQGIGTAIIHAAERLAARRGHDRIGMGVGDDNVRAAALYFRLGYQDTGFRYLDRYHHLDDGGVRHEITGPCRFLVKPISGTSG